MQRILLKGELTSPIDPGDRCRFCTRCLYARDDCFTRTPELKEASAGHFVACHYYDSLGAGREDNSQQSR